MMKLSRRGALVEDLDCQQQMKVMPFKLFWKKGENGRLVGERSKRRRAETRGSRKELSQVSQSHFNEIDIWNMREIGG